MIRSLIARLQALFQGRPWRYGVLPFGGEYHAPGLFLCSWSDLLCAQRLAGLKQDWNDIARDAGRRSGSKP